MAKTLPRLGYFDVSPEILVELLKTQQFERLGPDGCRERITITGVPANARGMRCGITQFGFVRVVFESDDMGELHEADIIPKVDVMVTVDYELPKP